jgi:hypothetical protein
MIVFQHTDRIYFNGRGKAGHFITACPAGGLVNQKKQNYQQEPACSNNEIHILAPQFHKSQNGFPICCILKTEK